MDGELFVGVQTVGVEELSGFSLKGMHVLL